MINNLLRKKINKLIFIKIVMCEKLIEWKDLKKMWDRK